MRRSFRVQLALRAAGAMALGLAAVGAVTFLSLRSALDAELNASILNVASIQAASLTEPETGEMHFHEWELTPDEAASLRDLIRYQQVWQADGVSLLRSQYMTSDLPRDTEQLHRAGAGTLVWSETRWSGIPIRSLYYPLERFGPAHERHVLQVAAPLTSRNALLVRVGAFFFALVLVMGATTYGGAWWLAGRAIRPVYEITDTAESVRGRPLDRRIQAYAEVAEYARLVEVLNGMLERIESAFTAQQRFTADASHELRSPLTAMRGELELALRRERPTDEYRQVLSSTLEEVIRLSRITEDLLILARSDSGVLIPRRESIETVNVVGRVVERLQSQAGAKGVVLRLEGGPDAIAEVDPVLLGQVVWNLTENAIKFSPPGGVVVVQVEGTGDHLLVRVEDTGPGFRDPEQAFRRFYREDAARTHRVSTDGTGLGLAIVQSVAEAHGGSVLAENRPEGGARVTVRFGAGAPPPERR